MPRAEDLSMVRGDTPTWRMSFSRAGGPLALPVGTLLWFTAKRELVDTDASAVFKKVVGTGVTIVDATNGVADISLLNADTQPLPDRDLTLVYDVQLKELDGRITTFRGQLLVRCDVTEALV